MQQLLLVYQFNYFFHLPNAHLFKCKPALMCVKISHSAVSRFSNRCFNIFDFLNKTFFSYKKKKNHLAYAFFWSSL